MERAFYLNLAHAGLHMPIAADVVLHESPDAQAILRDGTRLGQVLEATAARYCTPLAIPHMDLELEKTVLLQMLGVPADEAAKYHFDACPDDGVFDRFEQHRHDPFPEHLRAHIDSIGYIARQTSLLPVGMVIGPFSLATKLVHDPITPIALAGAGMTSEDDDDIRMLEYALGLGMRMILRSAAAQIDAGARAIFVAEPAANIVYFSPNHLDAGSDIFERFVMTYDRHLKSYLDSRGVDLIFHCCGELNEYILRQFTTLDPAILSLGSSRLLWEDAAIVPKSTVLYGNLPSKRFYSDALITAEQVVASSEALIAKMREVGHPFILGTECDVLMVPGCETAIQGKLDAIARMNATCGCAR